MNLLFICKHNRFRSKIAEAVFNNINKNKNNIAFSRGFKLDKKRMFIAPNVKLALKELGIKKVDNTPRKLKQEDLRNANIILNLASEIKLKIKNKKYKKIYNWHISDTDSKDYSGILKRAKLIKTKIIKLLREIN